MTESEHLLEAMLVFARQGGLRFVLTYNGQRNLQEYGSLFGKLIRGLCATLAGQTTLLIPKVFDRKILARLNNRPLSCRVIEHYGISDEGKSLVLIQAHNYVNGWYFTQDGDLVAISRTDVAWLWREHHQMCLQPRDDFPPHKIHKPPIT